MGLDVAIVGATGAVGAQFLKVLERGTLQVDSLSLYATARSAGRVLSYGNQSLVVQETTVAALKRADLVFISASSEVSRELAPIISEGGTIVIDDSSAFRMNDEVPLVVPEINADDLDDHHGIVSTPNCTSVPLVMALYPLNKANRIRRIVADTYQAVSGAGGAAVNELTEQATRVLGGQPTTPNVFATQIGFNVIPAVDSFMENGYSAEEMKMAQETRKILHSPDIDFSATCVRVPIYRGHCVAAHVEFEHPMLADEARGYLSGMSGLELADEPAMDIFPTPISTINTDKVLVGRIRQDISHRNGLVLWASGDNLMKGAALNAVQIAEEMYRRGLFKKV
ncbi:aspartate-semialdehyde dehydrogenase [Dehalococcoidia bacterium]|nr:aspartate-semialdehyde dehydrogenase [Dehalococcoidia bacterium]